MGTSVTVPLTADYQEIVFAAAAVDKIGAIVIEGDFIFATSQNEDALVRVDKRDFTYSIISFAGDAHLNAQDICYARGATSANDRVYILYPSTTMLVAAVNPNPTPPTSDPAFLQVDNTTLAGGTAGSIATDSTYLYVVMNPDPDNADTILRRFAISGLAQTQLVLTGYRTAKSVRVSADKLYVTGFQTSGSATTSWIAKIDATTFTMDSVATFARGADGSVNNNDVALDPVNAWVPYADASGNIRVSPISNLSGGTVVSTGIAAACSGVQYVNGAIWALYANGKAVRINPTSLALSIYTLDEGQNYFSNMVGDGSYLYPARYQVATVMSRYKIPTVSGGVLWANDVITGKAIAVDSSGIVGATRDGSPFIVYRCGLNGAFTAGFFNGTTPGKNMDTGYGKGVAFDSSGNMYACAGTGPNAYPYTVLYLSKLDMAGNVLWSKTNGTGTVGAADARSVVVDGAGSVIVTGNFWGTLDFGSGNVTATSVSDIFVAKYSSAGSLTWLKQVVPSGNANAQAVAVDSANSVYVMGQMSGTANFGQTLDAGTSIVPFVVKYNSAGVYVNGFGRVFAGGAQASIAGLAMTSAGIATFCGQYFNSFDFGAGTFTATFPGAPTGFVASYDFSGSAPVFRWAKNMADADSGCTSRAVAMDTDGNSILTGTLSGSFDFGAVTLTEAGGRDIFVAKYSLLGVNQWAMKAGGSLADFGNGVACFENGDVAATGTNFLSKLKA